MYCKVVNFLFDGVELLLSQSLFFATIIHYFVHHLANIGKTSAAFWIHCLTLAATILFLRHDFFHN
jgi:hypothetical protein